MTCRARTLRAGLALLWLALFLAGAASASAASAYVTSEGSGSLAQFAIGSSGLLTPESPFSVATGSSPLGVAVSPDGKSVYVVNSGSSGPAGLSQFSVADDGTLTPKSPATLATGKTPVDIAVSPDGRSVYVVNKGDGTVSQYDVGGGGTLVPKPVSTVGAGTAPEGVAISPGGGSVYVANSGDATVSEYDVGAGGALTPKATPTIPAGTGADQVAMTPNGSSVYVTDGGSNTVEQYSVGAGGALAHKSPATVTSGAHAGSDPAGIAISPDGQSAYVANSGDASVSHFSIAADGTLAPGAGGTLQLAGSATPVGVAVAPGGRSAYVADNSSPGAVDQFAVGAGGALSQQAPATVAAGNRPAFIGIPPDSGPTAAFIFQPVPPGEPSQFDAAPASGSVARYDWSFGDGATLADGGPHPSHVYAAPGNYTISLTIVDTNGCSTARVYTGRVTYCAADPAASTVVSVTVPAPAGPAKLRYAGGLRIRRNAISFRLACSVGPCNGAVRLASVERLRGRRLVGVAAGGRGRSVVVGRIAFTVPSGRIATVTVPLNSTGRMLLARFHRLPVRLTVTLASRQGPAPVIKSAGLVIKPPVRHRRRRRH